MKITGGGKKDYYDCMLALDKDPTPVFNRVFDSVYMEGINPPERSPWWAAHGRFIRQIYRSDGILPHPNNRNYGYDSYGGAVSGLTIGVVGFCGKIYPHYKVSSGIAGVREYTCCYNLDQLNRALQAKHDAILAYQPVGDAIKNWDAGKLALPILKQIEKIKDIKITKNTPAAIAWENFKTGAAITIGDEAFRHFNSPALYTNSVLWEVNTCLRDHQFQKVADPNQAWQTISQYLDNNLANVVTPPNPVSDELKAHAHGFDKKSFKNTKNRKLVDRGTWDN